MSGPASWRRPAVVVRVVPFALFMMLLALRGAWPPDTPLDGRWLYALTVLLVGGALLLWRRAYGELAWATRPSLGEAGVAVAVGLAVFVAWIHLDAGWMRLGEPSASYVPLDAQGALHPGWVAVRWVGAALVVPVMEELFWRSFLMRWIAQSRFEACVPAQVGLRALGFSTFVFMLAHTLWLAAILAGLAYALLYMRTAKLWSAVIAHAVTNGALGVWVVATGRWAFW